MTGKQSCPKCGCKDYVVSVVPKYMPHPGTYTQCPVCDKKDPLPLPVKKKKRSKKQ